MLLSVKTQLTSDNKFFTSIISNGLFSKSEVLILSELKIGYKDWIIGGLSCDVDADVEEDVDVDVDADSEELEGNVLQKAGTDTLSFTDQFLVSKKSADIDFGRHDTIDASLLSEEEYDDRIA